MRIGVGTTIMSRGFRTSGIDGIGQYSNNLLIEYDFRNIDYIQTNFSENFFNKNHKSKKNVSLGKYGVLASKFNIESSEIKQYKNEIDLFHALDYFIPTLKNCPTLATVMDTIPLTHPQWVTNSLLNFVKTKIWRSAIEKVDHVVTISNFSKDEILKNTNIHESKVSVIPLGVSDRFFKNSNKLSELIKILPMLPRQFFLAVGTIQPRKNFENLISAHQLLPKDYKENYPLVLVGRYGWGCDDLMKALRSNEYKNVIWLEYVQDNVLSSLISLCSVLVVPSLYEGFGLPVLEGFASKVPVISSNTTALPEVGSKYSIQIDSTDAYELSSAMRNVVDHRASYNKIIDDAYLYAKDYSWSNTAKKTLSLYKKII